MKLSDLVQALPSVKSSSLDTHKGHDPDMTGVAAIDSASVGMLSYVEGDRYAAQVAETSASALILPANEALQTQATERGIAWIESPYPRLTFAEAIALFYQPFTPSPGIHPTAVIDSSASLGNDVSIGAHVVIQAKALIGDGVCIHPNVVVYPEVSLGDRTTLHANCVIHERTSIGADCVIHCGAVIGSEGFGFVPVPDGWVKMHQSGIVALEDAVEVGCNAAIDRPAVGETRVRRGTKIDNLVHIAHGCQIDEHSVLAAQVGLAGQTILGKRVVLAGQVGVANGVTIGDKAVATAQTGIHRDVPAGEIVSGYPAIPNKLWLKISAVYNRLPEMYKTFRQIKRS
ncbi:MAG: UDP-3-O-(3-hydroxymyristoyl)glucosamine N-acyltransferase [Cyanobacteria bacterium P01_A01_bin.37]